MRREIIVIVAKKIKERKMKSYSISDLMTFKYLFFTGKGGVGKTSIACATAVAMADKGEQVLLISTDPASNLEDVFGEKIPEQGLSIKALPGLTIINIDPIKAANKYRNHVLELYENLLPLSAIKNIEEQLSGSCTVEIAAFNKFSDFLSSERIACKYDHIIFDTAPTGHTLRMLRLPSAWNAFIKTSKYGVSCLGQLSGLRGRKKSYEQAVRNLSDDKKTILILVSRPAMAPLKEAARASLELQQIGICNQLLIINGLMDKKSNDNLASQIYEAQQRSIIGIPKELQSFPIVNVPLRSYNLSNINNLRRFFISDRHVQAKVIRSIPKCLHLDDLIDDIYRSGKRIIFTMGKGGVGKTTIATKIAFGLKERGAKVRLTTTDPADHLNYQLAVHAGINISKIDPQEQLEMYKNEVRKQAKKAGVTDFSYIEEDLRSPCTQEIAVFRAFADIVEKASEEIVVIDTAPTGHTLLLLSSVQSYDRQISHTEGITPKSVKNLLPRLHDRHQTEVIIVTLPEATPVYEASRLQDDLERAGIYTTWWVVNQCVLLNQTNDMFLLEKAKSERQWIKKVCQRSNRHTVLIEWKNDESRI